jgi:hypothetical protein
VSNIVLINLQKYADIVSGGSTSTKTRRRRNGHITVPTNEVSSSFEHDPESFDRSLKSALVDVRFRPQLGNRMTGQCITNPMIFVILYIRHLFCSLTPYFSGIELRFLYYMFLTMLCEEDVSGRRYKELGLADWESQQVCSLVVFTYY